MDDTWVSEEDMSCPDLLEDYWRRKGYKEVIGNRVTNSLDQVLMMQKLDNCVLKKVRSVWIE